MEAINLDQLEKSLNDNQFLGGYALSLLFQSLIILLGNNPDLWTEILMNNSKTSIQAPKLTPMFSLGSFSSLNSLRLSGQPGLVLLPKRKKRKSLPLQRKRIRKLKQRKKKK